MASNLYQYGISLILDRTIDIASDTIKVMLVTSSYTPNKDDQFASTPAAYELSGTGYASGFSGSGRKTLASKAISYNNSSDKAYIDAADVTWTAINAGTAAYAIVYKHITSDAASPLIACVDIADTTTNGGDVTITWDSAGIVTISS